MLSYLDDRSFVEFVLQKGIIPFMVRGSVECKSNFNFAPFVNIRVSGPTFYLDVIGRDAKKEEALKVFIHELMDEAVFPGEIELPEKTTEGIAKALNGLELWADFLCLAVGNPKVRIEIQRPVTAVITTRSQLDVATLDRWASLSESYFRLDRDDRKKLSRVLWWYRKACEAAYYSLFFSYTAYWNCLEILCGVAGSRINTGPEVDRAIQGYLCGKKKITAGHILECSNSFVNYSIRRQIKDALKDMLGEEQASQLVYQCFDILPQEDRLFQIRNNINHGNIRENSPEDYERVYYRGLLLWHVVMTLLNGQLGNPISSGMDINTLAERFSDPSFRRGEA